MAKNKEYKYLGKKIGKWVVTRLGNYGENDYLCINTKTLKRKLASEEDLDYISKYKDIESAPLA